MAQSRQLAAIMFTDIVGYTALMGSDEHEAFQLLKKNRQIQQPLVKKYNGTWIKELGDGVLASFRTVTDSVMCAAAIHKSCAAVEGLQLRIGIHLGEVVFEEHDVFGDGVNIASRLQAIASPGEILVSEAVYTNIKNKKEFAAEFFGEETLKNVAAPVKIYRIRMETVSPGASLVDTFSEDLHRKGKPFNKRKIILFILGLVSFLAIGSFFYFKKDDKKKEVESIQSKNTDISIAVLPFYNMGDDPGQDYFADAMMDEILNHLFKIGGWRITSRTSAMSYRGSKKTMKEIASELGVANLLEGSVQKDGNRIRIRVQLIDGKKDEHLWVETYDREFKEVFAIQSEIAQEVANKLKINISPDVRQRIEALPTQSIEAYTLYLQARNLPEKSSKMALEKAIGLDSNFADAYTELAYYWLLQGTWNGNLESEQVFLKALPLLQKALQINPDLPSAHYHMANLQLWYRWDFKRVEEEYEKILQLYPSNTEITSEFQDYLTATGRFKEILELAINNFNNDKNSWRKWTSLAFAYQFNNQPLKALQTIESAESLFPGITYLKVQLIRLYVYNSRFEQAIQTFNRIDSSLEMKFHPSNLGHLAIAYYKTGQTKKLEFFLNELKRKSQVSSAGSPYFFLAAVYTSMGKNDLAIQSLEKAYGDHEVELYRLKVEPLFKALHNDPGFIGLLNKIGFK